MSPRRDPEARRQAIVEAAAALITEAGVVDLTHRRVAAKAGVPLGATTYYFASLDELSAAALSHLGDTVQAELEAFAAEVLARGVTPRVMAQVMHEYLSDGERVRAECALYFAGAVNAPLRPLSLRWFDGLVGLLSEHVGGQAAVAIAVYLDGACMHAMLHDAPLSAQALEATLEGLIR